MNSSTDKTMERLVSDRGPLLVAEAGPPYRAVPEGDAIAAWLDLMETVEALCPTAPMPEPTIYRDCRL